MRALRLSLDYFLAISLALTAVLYFLAENGRINAFATYLVAIATLVMLLIGQIDWRRINEPVFLSAVVFLFFLAASAAWASGEETILLLSGYGVLIISFLIGIQYCAERIPAFLTRFQIILVSCATLSALISLQLHFALPDYQPLNEPRLFGFGRLGNPVISAVSYGFAVVCAVNLAMHAKRGLTHALVLAAVVVLMTAIVLSGTRVVWLALGFAVGIAAGIQAKRYALPVFFGVFALVGLLALFITGWDELSRRALSFRPEIWHEYFSRTIDTNLLFGLGSGTGSKWLTDVETFKHAHSVFVSTFYYGGLVALILLLTLLGLCTFRLLNAASSSTRDLGISTLVFGITVGLFDGDTLLTKIDQQWWLVWFPVALVLCTVRAFDDHPGA